MATAINKLFIPKLTASNQAKSVEIAKKLKIDVNWLLGVIFFETARTMSPQKTNSIGSVGLIQFTHDPDTPNHKFIAGKQYSLAYIKSLSFDKQMDLVYEYYKPYAGKMNSFLDVYLVTFFPAALSKSDSYVLQTKSLSRSVIAKQNPIFDQNKDIQITRGEIKQFFAKWYTPSIFKEIQGTNYLPLILLFFFFLIFKTQQNGTNKKFRY